MAGGFSQYHEPSIVQISILISFFFFLSSAAWSSAKFIRADIIGQIAVGIIYGTPLANILLETWQETFLALGYIGLILIIFEGGLTTRSDSLKANFLQSNVGAATGVLFPIGLSYLLLYLGFGYGAVEVFIIGAALSATSLGTTFAVISSASKDVDSSQTRVGTVLISAAVIDDVSGLVMSSIISDLGGSSEGGGESSGWVIGRPILASALMAILTPISTKWFFAPIFRKFIEPRFHVYDHMSNIVLMVSVSCAFISIAAYAGTSISFGAFSAGTFLTYLPSKTPEGPFNVSTREEGEQNKDRSPTFVHTFEAYLMDVQEYLMAPLFFASIGFAIPFVSSWTGKAIWRGVVYTLSMAFAKVVVGVWIPVWDYFTTRKANAQDAEAEASPTKLNKQSRKGTWASAASSGSAMVARGEIGLSIVQIGYNETSYVSEDGFLTAIWAILSNTIIGPITVGLLVKYYGKTIGDSSWGVQAPIGEESEKDRAVQPDALESGRRGLGEA